MTDPVCGMEVSPESSAGSQEHQGKTYYFCSRGCLEKFAADPERWLLPAERTAAKAEAGEKGVTYTCPMHPQVVQEGPGVCPICGMALEPLVPTAEEEESEEYRDMRRRFLVSVLLTAPVVVIAMGHLLPGFGHLLPPRAAPWIQLLLATPVVLWGGWVFFVRGWQSLVSRSLNMFTLIALGVGVAWLYSVFAVLAPGIFPPLLPGRSRGGGGLLRGRGGDCHTGPARPGAGTARPQPHRRRHPRPARPGTEDSPSPA